MAKMKTGAEQPSSENPSPSLPGYESFHVTANQEASKRVADVLKAAGTRINETVWHEIGRPEYVIEVHQDDLVKAGEAFTKGLGSARTEISKIGNSGSTS